MDTPLLIAVTVAAACALVALLFVVQSSTKAKQNADLQQKNDELSTRIAELGRDLATVDEKLWRTNSDLEKAIAQEQAAKSKLEEYRPIMDAELRATEINRSAEEAAARARTEANSSLEKAQAIFEASKAKSNDILAQAKTQAEKVLTDAHGRARDIAADALAVRDKAEEYQRVVQALKNVIDGYGDEYVIPSSSVLDDLAEDYGFTEAGEKLKEARAKTRAMIKQGQAATCDYVEDIRRKTAIAFVIDAFNGKVDSILSKTKADNVGTLRQQILDACALVNKNGQAFRNARITDAFLTARLEELRWGAVATELRRLEAEEQRAIKERIRDEERAKKEYERAIKEAARDEAKIQAALEKARAEMASASESQKAKYEQQLEELSERLREAEARAQRALSMAQQTRSGHVYVISNVGSFGGDVFKIGMTRRLEPLDRVRELGDASVPFHFDVHAMMYSEDAPTLETSLHKKFNELRVNKVNPRKEFFRIGLAEVKAAAEELGAKAHFTMLAHAAEYRETLAIEKLPHEDMEKRLQLLMNQELVTEDTDE